MEDIEILNVKGVEYNICDSTARSTAASNSTEIGKLQTAVGKCITSSSLGTALSNTISVIKNEDIDKMF